MTIGYWDAQNRSNSMVLGVAAQKKVCFIVVVLMAMMADDRSAGRAKAFGGVAQTRITSDALASAGSAAPKMDESSLRNPSEKESTALHNTVYQSQPGTAPHVSITPPFLEFQKRPICIPVVNNIEVRCRPCVGRAPLLMIAVDDWFAVVVHQVINTSEDDELTLFSIITDSAHFHPPIFKQTVLAPLGKTTISVIFVPRSKGMLDGTLVIQTSLGGFLYQVCAVCGGGGHNRALIQLWQAHGEGIDNPYKVSPLLGAKVPVGVPYSPPMLLYNPFDTPLHVKEVYTSEGFLHLNLPKVRDKEASAGTAGLWELKPHQHKTVINLSFKSQSPGKYQGFVHMKTDRDNLVIPVEIIAIKGGVHRTPEELDFGTLTSPAERKSLSLSLLNSGSTPLVVTDIKMLSPDSHLSVEYKKHTLLPPAQERVIATVTYRGRTEGQFSGKLLVRLNNTNLANSRMEVPYKARVLHGSLGYSHFNTTFAVGRKPFEPVVKDLMITNKFPLSLVIQDVSIADSNFTLLDFQSGIVIRPGHTEKVLSTQFLASSADMLYQTHLSLSTNASVLKVPLHCYHGRLSFSVPQDQRPASVPSVQGSVNSSSGNLIDFGVLGVNEVRSRSFNLTNFNPMKTVVYYHPNHATDSSVSLELDGLWNRQGYMLTTTHLHHRSAKWSDNDEPIVELAPGQSALFTVKITSTEEETHWSEIFFSTHHENMTIQVSYQSVHGSLIFSPQPIRFEHSFPGARLTKSLMAKSTCNRPLTITSISSSDPRMIPVLTKQVLEPNKLMQVGHLVFNPSKAPAERNYMAVKPENAKGRKLSANGDPLTRYDLQAYTRRNELWKEIRSIGSQAIHATIVVDTDVVMGGTVNVNGGLFKPSVVMVEDSRASFGLTQVGSVVENYVRVHNPSDNPVYMQLIRVFANSSLSSLIHTVTPKVLHSSDFQLSAQAIEGRIVPPHTKSKLGPIYFHPSGLRAVNATFFVKNNLTLLDPIVAHGEGGSGYFHFQAGLTLLDSLRFDLNESDFKGHLKSHADSKDAKDGASEGQHQRILFHRTFRATNRGNLPIEIHSIEVNGQGCSAYGFEIHNCSSFMLNPEESANILISFHPDFSASEINRELFVTTSLGIQRIPVVATLPHHMLPELVDMVVPTATFSGVRQLCLMSAAVVLVLMTHFSMSDLVVSMFEASTTKVVSEDSKVSDKPNGKSDVQDLPSVKIEGSTKASGKKDEKEVKRGQADDSSGGVTVVPKASKDKKGSEKGSDKHGRGEVESGRGKEDADSHLEEPPVKPKSKKEKDQEKKEKERQQKEERRERERRERQELEEERRFTAEQEKAAKAAAEVARKNEVQRLREEEEQRKQEANRRNKQAPKGGGYPLPQPRNSVESDGRPRRGSLDRKEPPVTAAATNATSTSQQARVQKKPATGNSKQLHPGQEAQRGKTGQQQQPVDTSAPQQSPWGLRDKAAGLLANPSDRIHNPIHNPGAPGRAAPPGRSADPFASTIGSQPIHRATIGGIGGQRAPGAQPAAPGLGFSSVIGGDPIGGDVIWQQPQHRGVAPGPGLGRVNDPFSSAIGGSSIGPFSEMGSPKHNPTPAPGQLDPFGQPIGGARNGSRFGFSNAADPFFAPPPPANLGGSLFSSNPFFAAPAPGAGGFSSALGGDLLQAAKEADALNDDTFGPSSYPPGPPIQSDLSPHTAAVIPGQNSSFGALGNGTGAPGFGTFSDLHKDSVPFDPSKQTQQQQQQQLRNQSRFAFPSGTEEGDLPPEGSRFSLFG